MSKKATKVQATETVVTESGIPASVLEALGEMSVSAKIRALNSQGFSRGQIAKALNKRYQHVRNVLITPLKGRAAKAE